MGSRLVAPRAELAAVRTGQGGGRGPEGSRTFEVAVLAADRPLHAIGPPPDEADSVVVQECTN